MSLVTNSSLQISELSGIWHSKRWFPNTKHHGREDTSEFYVRFKRTRDGFVMYSLPGASELYIQAYMVADTNLLTGSFAEDKAPDGEWMGLHYEGVFQFIVRGDLKQMSGLWVCVGYNNGTPAIFDDRWEITYAGEELETLPPLNGQPA